MEAKTLSSWPERAHEGIKDTIRFLAEYGHQLSFTSLGIYTAATIAATAMAATSETPLLTEHMNAIAKGIASSGLLSFGGTFSVSSLCRHLASKGGSESVPPSTESILGTPRTPELEAVNATATLERLNGDGSRAMAIMEDMGIQRPLGMPRSDSSKCNKAPISQDLADETTISEETMR